MTTALATIGQKLSTRFGMGDNTTEVLDILKNTAFKGGNVTDAQMTSLMIVADQYGLNPWTREIYAFPDKGGIVPVVGVDGWSRIINEHPQFDGLEFEQNDESCTCIMYRKDRSHAIKVTEWLSECKRENAQPWKTHPKRMLRHKSLIQCARLAFGFVGIYDQDEAERIVEIDITPRDTAPDSALKPELPEITADELSALCADKLDPETGEVVKVGYRSMVQSSRKTAADFIEWLSKKATVTDEIKAIITKWQPIEGSVA